MNALVATLDRHLASRGQDIVLKRRIGTTSTFATVTCRAKVAGFNSEVLIGGVKQTASDLVISPTAIEAAFTAGTWPGAAGGDPWPKVGDFIRQSIGGDRKIEATRPVIIDGQVVRIEAKVLG